MMFLKMFVFGLEIFWFLLFCNWWVAPWFLRKERSQALIDIDESKFLFKWLAWIFYSPLFFPLRSLVIFVIIFVATIFWIK